MMFKPAYFPFCFITGEIFDFRQYVDRLGLLLAKSSPVCWFVGSVCPSVCLFADNFELEYHKGYQTYQSCLYRV